ncbi:hypothetical protein FA13DRAFT_1746466 [Coprinellus micaceus]|uniref:Uncharacterized protein n=1 Tax=Coprinellus micaceus TaxID=71717 RepID=A0A4Y7SBF3_COPMI|nr:hypothetical protein FA13DRAFT_1746466 [Coprinellus micaceus]
MVEKHTPPLSTPAASISVSISTPEGDHTTARSLSTPRTLDEPLVNQKRDFGKEIRRFSGLLNEAENRRRKDSQIIQRELQALRQEFRDLAQFLRGQPRWPPEATASHRRMAIDSHQHPAIRKA